MRWVARRPAEAIPAPRPRRQRVGPTLIPRYPYLPQWGLRDTPPADLAQPPERASADLGWAWRVVGIALACSAGAHLLRYLVVVVNRDRPVAGWIDTVTGTLVLFCGIAALLAFIYATVRFALWVSAWRESSFSAAELAEPRRRWVLILFSVVPVVNLVTAPLLILEAVAVHRELQGPRTRRRLTRIWVAWVMVNVVAAVALAARIHAWRADTLQAGADAVVLVAISAGVSAAFAFWMARRLPVALRAPGRDDVASRWVVAV